MLVIFLFSLQVLVFLKETFLKKDLGSTLFLVNYIFIFNKNAFHAFEGTILNSILEYRSEYGELLHRYPFSVQIRENIDQKNSVFEHRLCSVQQSKPCNPKYSIIFFLLKMNLLWESSRWFNNLWKEHVSWEYINKGLLINPKKMFIEKFTYKEKLIKIIDLNNFRNYHYLGRRSEEVGNCW